VTSSGRLRIRRAACSTTPTPASACSARWSASCADTAGRRRCARRSWTRWAWPGPACRRRNRTRAASRSTRGPTSCSSSRLTRPG
jgi:hypothetical protein